MTGKGKSITPEFRVGESRLFFPVGYVNKESARTIAKRFINSKCYDYEKSHFYKVIKKGNRLIIINDKNIRVFPLTGDDLI